MDDKPLKSDGKEVTFPFQPITLRNDAPVESASEDADFLNFTPLAKEVAAIAVGTEGPFTMAVTAKWGHGKTSMLKLVQDLIRQYGEAAGGDWSATHTTVWFNAWQYEREEEPVVPLLLAIQEAIAENVREHESLFDKVAPAIWDKLKKLPRALGDVASGFKLKGKVGTAFWLQFLTGVKGEIEVEAEPGKAIEALRETFTGEKQEALPETVFMRAMWELNAISKGLREAGKDRSSADKPKIVVFVDDLDRCHPDAALRLLDGIKLVLDQPGFVFVLALDKTILEEFLVRRYRREYGAKDPEEVGRRYIDKIVQLEVPLPPQVGRYEGSNGAMRSQPDFRGKGYLEKTTYSVLQADYAPQIADVIRNCGYLSPRDVIRLLLRLRLDLTLYRTAGKPIEGLGPTEIAVAAVIMRLTEGAFSSRQRGDFLSLVIDPKIAERLWRGVSTRFNNDIDGSPPLPAIDAERLSISVAVTQAIRGPRGLVDALSDYGER